jgi:hypothetical protein
VRTHRLKHLRQEWRRRVVVEVDSAHTNLMPHHSLSLQKQRFTVFGSDGEGQPLFYRLSGLLTRMRIKAKMANGTPNPNPRATVWGILCVAFFLVLFVGWMAVSTASQGFFHFNSSGGTLPAAFVFIAVIVGVACVAYFVHRGHGNRK